MGYELDALLGRTDDAARWKRDRPDLVVVALTPSLGMVPLTSDMQALMGPPESWVSLAPLVAHLSADYFGGVGGHDCTLWVDGREAGRGLDINEVLARFGVEPSPPQDAFDTVGLGRYRSTGMWLAMAAVEEASTPDALLGLLKDDPRSLVREKAVKRLEEVEDARVTAALADALGRDDDYGVRLAAAGALSLRGQPGADALVGAVTAAAPDDLWGLLHALGKMGTPARSSAARVMPQLRHADWRIRIEAARTLGLCGATEAVEALRLLLEDPEDLVRSAAKEALDRLR